MEIDAEKMLVSAIRQGIQEGIAKKFDSYNSPLNKLLENSLQKYQTEFQTLLENAISSCVSDPEFRQNVSQAVRHSLAKILVQRFGGELEKQVNVLKSDPTTRARITIAIEEIVKSQTQR